jgi:hypothetical protein
MIATLDDAWRWYDAVRRLAWAMDRLGDKYWDRPEWDEALGRDNHFRHLGSDEIRRWSRTVLTDLDDLGVLLLFSVFEASVRARAIDDIERALPTFHHPALIKAIEQMKESIANGRFFRVTEAYKSLDSNLAEEVNQVRKFRNWVAHGRRGSPANDVDPPAALDRLRRFFDRMTEAAKSPPIAPDFVDDEQINPP